MEPKREHTSYAVILRSRWIFVSLATLLYWTGANALRPLVPLRLDALGASEFAVGAVMALFPLSSLVVAIPGGRLADQVGVRRVALFGFCGMAALGFGLTVANSVTAIAVVIGLMGLTELASWVALQSLASVGGSGSFLVRQLAVFSLAWGFGQALGPMIGAVIFDARGFAMVAVFYFLCGFLAIVFILIAPRVPVVIVGDEGPSSIRSSVFSMLMSAPVRLTVISSFVVLFVFGIRGSFLPLFLERAGLSIPRIGVILSAIGIASLLARFWLPALVARFGEGHVLVASMWVAIIPMAMMPAGRGFVIWLLLAIVSGFGLGVNPPITVVLMSQHTDIGQRGLAMGLRLSANRLAQVVQPVMFGGLIAVSGFGLAFAVSGGVLAAITGWSQATHRRALEA